MEEGKVKEREKKREREGEREREGSGEGEGGIVASGKTELATSLAHRIHESTYLCLHR